jgi:hypothetical protein
MLKSKLFAFSFIAITLSQVIFLYVVWVDTDIGPNGFDRALSSLPEFLNIVIGIIVYYILNLFYYLPLLIIVAVTGMKEGRPFVQWAIKCLLPFILLYSFLLSYLICRIKRRYNEDLA